MTIRTRRILFFTSFLIFLITSPAIIMYSLGYKLNIENFKIQKTGGIFVNIKYDDYRISVNERIKKDVTKKIFLQKGVLIPNLLTKNYKVSVEKDGYLEWSKTLKVESGIITEVRNIFLMPKELVFEDIENNTLDFIISVSGEKIAYLKQNSVTLYDIKNEKKSIIEGIEKKMMKLVGFTSDENDIFLENDSTIYKTSYSGNNILEIQKSKKELYLNAIPSIEDRNIIYVLSDKNTLYEINFLDRSNKNIISEIVNFYLTDKDIFYLTKEPKNFYKKDISSEKTTQLTFHPLNDMDIHSKIIKKFNDPIAIIDTNKNLFLFNYKSETFNKLSSDVIDAELSTDLSKILYLKDREVYVYYLEDSYPSKKSGEIDLIGRFGQQIKDASWFSYNNHHIFLNMENNIQIIELDGRDKRNSYEIIKNVDKFRYNNTDQSIYFIKDGNLKKAILLEE
ncbi:MAG: hypothetical protein AAB614_02475 [Patescibacteria group bacterium]